MSVMVVVPSFSEGEKRYPEVISRGVTGLKTPRPPHVRGRVDQPGAVKIHDGAEEDAPEEEGPSAYGEKDYAEDGDGDPMPSADPDVEFIFAEVGDVGEEGGGIVVNALAGEDPTYVRPEAAVLGECGSPSLSVFWWCMRWMATKKMGPPSRASVPQVVSAYSTHLGVL